MFRFLFFKCCWWEKLRMNFDSFGKHWTLKCMLRFTSVTNYCKEKPTVLSIFFSCGCLGGQNQIFQLYTTVFFVDMS